MTDTTSESVVPPVVPNEQNPPPSSSPKPESTPASAIEGGREVSDKILYVGGLHKSVSETHLRELLDITGGVKTIKILNDKNKPGFNYAFVEFEDHTNANSALHTLNGRIVNNSEIKMNWAYQSSSIASAGSPEHPAFNIFVGDLSPEVDDECLGKAFAKFESMKQAHVMWDMQTSRSRGYGFVTFENQADAELALQTMNGEWINGRAIRCNWASHKQANANPRNGQNRHHNGSRQYRPFINNLPLQQPMPPATHINDLSQPGLNTMLPNGQQIPPNTRQNNLPVMSPQSFDIVLRQKPSWQTTVYLGNIAHFTQQADLIPLLQNFGYIVDFKFHPERGCAFVKFNSHERAALAIVQLTGFTVNGRPLKCGWGKDRPPMGQFNNFRAPGYIQRQ